MADERVQAAIRNWAGRFIANGIDYNDFVRTTASIARWEEWLDAWTATAEAHVALAERRRCEPGTAERRRGLCPGRGHLPLLQVRVGAGPRAQPAQHRGGDPAPCTRAHALP